MSKHTPLSPALSGERRELDTPNGRVSFYIAGPTDTDAQQPRRRPLLLVHSVNAAASAYEIRPLFEHYRRERQVIALDLPGYGFSDRPQLIYTPRIMTDALIAVLGQLDVNDDDASQEPQIDALAVSLSCEFLARAALESPRLFHTVALMGPTGFSGKKRFDGPIGSNRGKGWVYKTVAGSDRIGRGLFTALTSRPSVRYFLQKTWGRKEIDEGAFEYAYATAHQPGARHAPFSFLSGYLFSADINRIYESLTQPVWMSHGTRGDFIDYRRKTSVADRPNWQIDTFDTGALPHFEILGKITETYDAFLNRAEASV